MFAVTILRNSRMVSLIPISSIQHDSEGSFNLVSQTTKISTLVAACTMQVLQPHSPSAPPSNRPSWSAVVCDRLVAASTVRNDLLQPAITGHFRGLHDRLCGFSDSQFDVH